MNGRPSVDNFEEVCTGETGAIRLAPDVYAAYRQAICGNGEIETKRRVQLDRYFREFCDHEYFFRRLSDQKFKNEGNFPVGKGCQVTVWAFKAWQWRLYGAILQVNGTRCFVGVNVDPNKKQDKADRKLLRDTAAKIANLQEYGA